MSKLDDILLHTVYREGNGPNGSGGEFYYMYKDKTVPLKEAIIETFRDAMSKPTKAQDSVGIAEALGDFAQKTSRQTALHWYMGFDDNGKVAMFPEEIGLPLKQAVTTTIETIKKATAKDYEG